MRLFRRSRLLAACFVLTLSVVSCAVQRDKQQGEQVVAHHFEMRARGAYDAVLAEYDELFFDRVTRSEWRSALTSVAEKLGPVQSYDITASEMDKRAIAGPGTYLKYKCRVTYADHTSLETFYLFRRQGAERFRILGHQIDSLGLVSR